MWDRHSCLSFLRNPGHRSVCPTLGRRVPDTIRDMKRALFVFSLSLLFATAVFAQEFGRTSGGDIDLITKHPQQLSGSLGFSAGSGRGFDGTLGGTLVKDRVWFFATAEKNQQPLFASQNINTQNINTKLTANLGDRQTLATSFAASQPSAPVALPSSFLSLHYTGIVSSNMFVTGSFSELKRSNY